MKRLFTNEFYRIVDNNTFYNKWLLKFIDDIDYYDINYQISGFRPCSMAFKEWFEIVNYRHNYYKFSMSGTIIDYFRFFFKD